MTRSSLKSIFYWAKSSYVNIAHKIIAGPRIWMGLNLGPYEVFSFATPGKMQNPIFVGEFRRTLWVARHLRSSLPAVLRPSTPSTQRPRRRSSLLLQGTRLSSSTSLFVSIFVHFFSRYLVVLIACCVGVRFVLRLLWEGVGGGVGRPPIRGGVQAGSGWVRQALPLNLGYFFLFFCLFFSLLACGCFDCGRLEICCFCCW